MRKTVIIAALVLVALLVGILLFGVALPLGFANSYVESLAGDPLGRRVEISDPIRLRASLRPELILGRVRISSPDGWPEETPFLEVERARAKLGLLALIRGEIEIDRLIFEDFELRLVSTGEGSSNFRFDFDGESTSDGDRPALAAITRLELRDARVSYENLEAGKRFQLEIDEALGKGAAEEPLTLSARGELEGTPWGLELSGDPLPVLIGRSGTWALSASRLTVGDSELEVSGSIETGGSAMTADLSVSVSGDDLGEILALVDRTPPFEGPYALRSEIRVSSHHVALSDLWLEALEHSVNGSIDCDWSAERPNLSASLSLPEIDAARLSGLAASDPAAGSPPAGVGASTPSSIPWTLLDALNGEVELAVGRLSAGPLVLEETRIDADLADGNLHLDASSTLDRTAMSGRLVVATTDGAPTLEAALTADGVRVPSLLRSLGQEKLLDNYDLNGRIGSVRFEAGSRGYDLHQLIADLSLQAKLEAVRLSAGDDPLFSTTELSLEREAGAPYRLVGNGELLGRPFAISAGLGRSTTSEHEPFFELDLEACDVRLSADATVFTDPTGSGFDVQFTTSGRHLCGVLAPAESFLGAATTFTAKGNSRLWSSGWSLEVEEARLGEVTFEARAELALVSGRTPMITADLHSSYLDLSPFLGGEESGSGTAATSGAAAMSPEKAAALIKSVLAREILPRRRLLASDANLRLSLDRLDLGRGGVSDLEIRAEMRDGALVSAPSRVEVAGRVLTGDARVDLTGEMPAIHLELATEDVHLPALFEEFQLEGAPNLTADSVSLRLEMEGRSLRELLRGLDTEVVLAGGRWKLGEGLTPKWAIEVDNGRYSSSPGSPATLALTGRMNAMPLSLTLTEDGFFAKRKGQPFTMSLEASLGATELTVEGTITREPDRRDAAMLLSTSLSGPRLDELNGLLGLDLPPLGPYAAKGALEVAHGEFDFRDLLLKIGDTRLEGRMVVVTTPDETGLAGYPLHLTVRLRAKTIQLDDFRLARWSATAPGEDSAPEGSSGGGAVAPRVTAGLSSLIGPEVAERVTGSVEIDVGEVLSGRDRLGGGRLEARLEDGTYFLDEVRLDVPGGSVRIRSHVRPERERATGSLGIYVDHLDYGVLARRVQPESDLKGDFNLNLELQAEASSLGGLGREVNGRLRVAVVPEEFEAGVIDLWAVNIIYTALPILMKGKESVVNCLAGDFTLTEGVVRPELFMLDTGRVRVEGKGDVNLGTGVIDFHMRPTPKRPQFFAAATPIKVAGTIFDPEFGVTTGSVLGTIVRMASSIVTTPFKKVFTKNMEPSGEAACHAAMAWATTSWED